MKDFLREVQASIQDLGQRVGSISTSGSATGSGGEAVDSSQLAAIQQKLNDLQTEFRQKMNVLEHGCVPLSPSLPISICGSRAFFFSFFLLLFSIGGKERHLDPPPPMPPL